jgi:hypothetical protein
MDKKSRMGRGFEKPGRKLLKLAFLKEIEI